MTGVFHRALADAGDGPTSGLPCWKSWRVGYGIIDPDFEWLLTLGKKPKQVIPSFLREYATRK